VLLAAAGVKTLRLSYEYLARIVVSEPGVDELDAIAAESGRLEERRRRRCRARDLPNGAAPKLC